jgi:hypothetical protein
MLCWYYSTEKWRGWKLVYLVLRWVPRLWFQAGMLRYRTNYKFGVSSFFAAILLRDSVTDATPGNATTTGQDMMANSTGNATGVEHGEASNTLHSADSIWPFVVPCCVMICVVMFCCSQALDPEIIRPRVDPRSNTHVVNRLLPLTATPSVGRGTSALPWVVQCRLWWRNSPHSWCRAIFWVFCTPICFLMEHVKVVGADRSGVLGMLLSLVAELMTVIAEHFLELVGPNVLMPLMCTFTVMSIIALCIIPANHRLYYFVNVLGIFIRYLLYPLVKPFIFDAPSWVLTDCDPKPEGALAALYWPICPTYIGATFYMVFFGVCWIALCCYMGHGLIAVYPLVQEETQEQQDTAEQHVAARRHS